MKSLILVVLVAYAGVLQSQKLYFSGFGIKGTTMNENSDDREKADYVLAASILEPDKRKVAYIHDNLLEGSVRKSVFHTSYLGLEAFFRFNNNKQWLQWAEWTIGAGFTQNKWFSMWDNTPIYRHIKEGDTIQNSMMIRTGNHNGLMLESKLVFNSSPYKSRLMKYIGIGTRIGMFSQKNDRIEFFETNYSDRLHPVRIKSEAPLSNMSSTLLGLFGTLGLKYHISCLFSVYADANLGYYARMYPEKVTMEGRNFALSLGVKYKMGNVPDARPEEVKEDEKSLRNKRKKMEVYW